VEVLTTRVVPKFEYYDPELAGRVPKDIEVHRVFPGWIEPSMDRARLKRAAPMPHANGSGRSDAVERITPRTLLRELYLWLHPFKIPDPTFEWIIPGILRGLRLIAHRRYDLIVSSGAPFSSHVVAHALARWSRAPWVADFSDPYADNPFVARPPWRGRVDRGLEAGWFRRMSGAIVPVPEMKSMFLRHHPDFPAERLHVLSYGYDETLYASTTPAAFERFTVVHTGSFYPELRDPGPFFEALALTLDVPLHVIHAGILQPGWVRQLHDLGIADRFEVLGLLSREAIAPLQLGGACLLLIGNRGGLQLPGKLFDYLGAGRPIFALRNDRHDIAADLVKHHGAGLVVPNEPADIAAGLRQIYGWWKDGSLGTRYRHSGGEGYAWSRLEDRLDLELRSHLRPPAAATA
jgi:hypothetical protein